ncbi:MAG: DUF2959 domain-containing protein [Planctomycetota bacterium]|nr:DUF2959 domain-containing protein [Planctomycetota bacterium]
MTGCSIFSGSNNDGPAQVNSLVGSIERVYVDAELSRERVKIALQALQAIADADFNEDAVTSYTLFVTAIEESEKQADRLRDAVEPMKKSAGPVFAQWEDDLGQFTSESMKQRSQARLDATRARYDAIVAAVDPAQEQYDAFNQALRDHALFLANDFNPSALKEIRAGVVELTDQATGMDAGFDTTMLASRSYVQSAALPMSIRKIGATKQEDAPERVEKVSGGR